VGRREYVTVGRGRTDVTGGCQYPAMTDEFGDALGPLPFSTLRERYPAGEA
jgi:hypothetical protein